MARDKATIMGGETQFELEESILELCGVKLNDYFRNEKVLTQKIFESHFEEIISFIEVHGEYYHALSVLGVLILKTGSNLPINIKHAILHHINFDEEKSFWEMNPKYIEERKFYLNDFKEKILLHKRGQPRYLIDLKQHGGVDFNQLSIGLEQLLHLSGKSNTDNITNINLDSSDLEKFPDEILNFKNIEILSINHNYLKSLPDDIKLLKKIKEIYLSNNAIKVLPNSIGDLKNLETLDLFDNDLTSLPESIGNLENLKNLNIYYNPIQKLPKSFAKLQLDNFSLYLLKEMNLLAK